MLDHTFEEPEEEREREAVDEAHAHSTFFHARGDDRLEPDSDPLFTTLRAPRKQAGDFRPVLSHTPGADSLVAPGDGATPKERAA